MKIIRFRTIIARFYRQLRDPLFKNSFFLASSRIINISVGFFFWMAAARIYSVGDVGLTTALIASQSLITLFSLFGFDFSLIRFLPASNKRNVYNTCLVITSVFSIIISVLYISCIEIISPELVFLQKHKLAAFFLLFSLLNTITLINGNALGTVPVAFLTSDFRHQISIFRRSLDGGFSGISCQYPGLFEKAWVPIN
jgi:O-antigen/teichoic acid export membrane protein